MADGSDDEGGMLNGKKRTREEKEADDRVRNRARQQRFADFAAVTFTTSHFPSLPDVHLHFFTPPPLFDPYRSNSSQ